jgi:hypothetical protein
LRADTNTVALLDVLYVLSNLDCLANDLVADDAGWEMLVVWSGEDKMEYSRTVRSWAPARGQHVQV